MIPHGLWAPRVVESTAHNCPNAHSNTHESQKMKKLVPILLIAFGVALMAVHIYVESEPGAIPLALIILGLGSYLLTRNRNRRDQGTHS